jgi:hypothetical protein
MWCCPHVVLPSPTLPRISKEKPINEEEPLHED